MTYWGTNPFTDLKANSKIFLKQAGSQWKETKAAVTCSCLWVPVKRCAVVFWTTPEWEIETQFMPAQRALQYPKQVDIKAWITCSKSFNYKTDLIVDTSRRWIGPQNLSVYQV